jgi:hypothetical protein
MTKPSPCSHVAAVLLALCTITAALEHTASRLTIDEAGGWRSTLKHHRYAEIGKVCADVMCTAFAQRERVLTMRVSYKKVKKSLRHVYDGCVVQQCSSNEEVRFVYLIESS